MGLSFFDEQRPVQQVNKIDAAVGTALVVAWNEEPFPSRVDWIIVANSDVIPHVVDVWYNKSSYGVLVGSVSVPAGAGYGGSPSIDLLAAMMAVPFTGLLFDNNGSLSYSVEVAVTAAFTVTLLTIGGDL